MLRIVVAILLAMSASSAFAQGGWYPNGDTSQPAMADAVTACKVGAENSYSIYYPDFILESKNSTEHSVGCVFRRQSSNTGARYNGLAYFKCPSGYKRENGQCVNTTEPAPEENQCPTAGNNKAPPADVLDPINTQTGNVSLTITDISSGGARPLAFTRQFNSKTNGRAGPLGAGWRHNHEVSLRRLGSSIFEVTLPSGGTLYFYNHSRRPYRPIMLFSNNTFAYVNNRRDKISFSNDQYTYTDENGDRYVFENIADWEVIYAGKFISRDGYEIDYIKGLNDNIVRIEDSFGKSIDLTYTSGTTRYGTTALLQSIFMDDGQTVTYDLKRNKLGYQFGKDSEVSQQELELDATHWFELRDVTYADSQIAHYSYDVGGSRMILLGASGNPGMPDAAWAYDSNGWAISNQLAGGVNGGTITYEKGDGSDLPYNPSSFTVSKTDSLKTSVTYANGLEESFRYARNNNIVHSGSVGQLILEDSATEQTPSCAAATRDLEHDVNGYRSAATDAEGNVTHYTNDGDGRVLVQTDAVGTPQARVTTYQWHATLPLPLQIKTPTVEQYFTYDTQNRLTQRTEIDRVGGAAPRTTTYTWLAGGLINTIDGPLPGNQDMVDYDYDADGNLARITDETGRIYDVLSVDAVGRPTRINDFEGIETIIAYNLRGWPTTITEVSQNAVTAITYTGKGYIQQIDNPDGTSLAFAYDLADRLISITNNVGDVISYQYDIMSNLTGTTITNANSDVALTSQSVFDELNRIRDQVGGNLQQASFNYDRENRLTEIIDPANGIQDLSWNALDQLTQMVAQDSGITDFVNRDDGALTGVTDPENLTTSYTYNGFGDVISMVSPDTGQTDYLVDEAGRVTRRTDARGQITDYSYDAADRPLSVSYAGSGAYDQSWSYDGFGRLTNVTHKGGSLGFGYDGRSNITSHSRAQNGKSYAQSMGYDGANRMTAMAYPSGRSIAYSYDAAGRIAGLSMSAPGEPTRDVFGNLTYDGAGSLTGATYVNGLGLTRSYDASGRLTSQSVSGGVQGLTFGYDSRDNIVAITDSVNAARNQSFGYDAMSRLISASGAYGSYAYDYDLVGNRTRRTVNVLIEDYQYINGTHRLGSVTAAGVARSFSYQPSGQMAADNDNGIVTTFALDPEGRVNAVTRAGVAAASYIYDAFNLRSAKTVAAGIGDETGSIHFVYDLEGRLIAEHDGGTGAVLREYVYYGLMPVAMIAYDALGGAEVYAVHTDQVNMPQKLTGTGGIVVHDRVTTPFGETISVTGTLTQTLRFPGQRNDSETGLFQNWHRDYDPSLGRYVQSDPIGLAGGINTYAYVGGNPVTYVDPTGLIPEGNRKTNKICEANFDRKNPDYQREVWVHINGVPFRRFDRARLNQSTGKLDLVELKGTTQSRGRRGHRRRLGRSMQNRTNPGRSLSDIIGTSQHIRDVYLQHQCKKSCNISVPRFKRNFSPDDINIVWEIHSVRGGRVTDVDRFDLGNPADVFRLYGEDRRD